MLRNDWRRLALVLLLAAPAASGCGKRDGNKVSGKVYYDGKPLSSGSIIFIDARGNPRGTTIGQNGDYAVVGLPKGEAKIAVVSHAGSPGGLQIRNGRSPAPPFNHESKPSLPQPLTIPTRYGNHDQSDLTCQVTGRDQSHDIELKP